MTRKAMKVKKGDRGSEVVDIQRRLTLLGYDLGETSVDGAFEEKTEQAVKDFQIKSSLSATGVVDSTTWKALVDASYKLGDRALYLRFPFLHGKDVFLLQEWLNSLGFHLKEIDGIFGPDTDKSVKDFQINVGLFPDGIVGSSTLRELLNLQAIIEKGNQSILINSKQDFQPVTPVSGKDICIGSMVLPNSQSHFSVIHRKTIEDLASRLANLLEVLGAKVNYSLKEVASSAAQARVIFCLRKLRPFGFITSFPPNCLRSRKLASLVARELHKSLDQPHLLSEIQLPELQRCTPVCLIQVSSFWPLNKNQLEEDAFRQKVASAILDGLEKFFVD